MIQNLEVHRKVHAYYMGKDVAPLLIAPYNQHTLLPHLSSYKVLVPTLQQSLMAHNVGIMLCVDHWLSATQLLLLVCRTHKLPEIIIMRKTDGCQNCARHMSLEIHPHTE